MDEPGSSRRCRLEYGTTVEAVRFETMRVDCCGDRDPNNSRCYTIQVCVDQMLQPNRNVFFTSSSKNIKNVTISQNWAIFLL